MSFTANGKDAMAQTLESVRLQEYCTNAGQTPKVDRENGIIRGVKILGSQSRNRGDRHFSYPASTRSKAVPLYEGAVCNVDHHEKGKSVSYRDRIGVFRNVTAREDGVFGDLHFCPKHELAEQLCWDAEHAPEKLGFSHLADGKVNRSNPKAPTVEEITAVESVDLVANPATTRGMWESEGDVDDFAVHGFSAISDLTSVMLGEGTNEQKTARLQEVLSVWQAELAGTTHKEFTVMEWKDISVASLQENRKDLYEQITGTDALSKKDAEAKKLQEQLDLATKALKEATDKLAASEAEKAKAVKQTAIAEELKAAGVKTDDAKVCTPALMAQLAESKDAEARKPIIELMAMAQKVSGLRESASSGGAPFADIGGSNKEDKSDVPVTKRWR